MDTRLAVDDHNQLQETRISGLPVYSGWLRIPAKIISYVFHPLFVPVYVVWFLVYVEPYFFAGADDWNKKVVIIQAIVMYVLFPLVTVLLLRALRFIDSIMLKTQRDRIIPYVACGIWYFWAWYVRHNLPGTPGPLIYFSLAIFLASSAGLIANIYLKASMHAMAMGVAASFMLLLGFSQGMTFSLYIAVTLVAAGLVCTSRLVTSDHTPGEIYAGLFIGIAAQLVAYVFT
jgi:hypothetical protein